MPTVTYEPVGFCIYCRSKDADLTDEHILPLGFGGNYVLPRSSCAKCQEIIGRLEVTVLRHMFGGYRMKVGMPSRHRRNRSHTITTHIRSRDGQESAITIDAALHPGIIGFPTYPYPGIVNGEQPMDDWEWGYHIIVPSMRSYNALLQQTNGVAIRTHLDGLAFARVLAKIALGFAFGERVPLREPSRLLLRDLILGNSAAATHVVGCLLSDIPDHEEGVPHKCTLRRMSVGEREYVCADIRLFAYLPTPIYRVIIAESPPNPSEPASVRMREGS